MVCTGWGKEILFIHSSAPSSFFLYSCCRSAQINQRNQIWILSSQIWKCRYQGKEEGYEEWGKQGADGKAKRIGDGRNGVAMVEVVEDGDDGNWGGLLGVGFTGDGRWIGSMRLLLLDETYADRDVEQMLEATKVDLSSDGDKKSPETS